MKMDLMNLDKKNKTIKNVTGVVLAGGKSIRFGKNKAIAEINGERLISRVVNMLGLVFEKIIIISNSPYEYRYLDVPIYEDIIKGLGPLGGIYTGLSYMDCEAGFFVACDMPFLNEHLIRHMIEIRTDYDAVIPKIDWRIEALHSL